MQNPIGKRTFYGKYFTIALAGYLINILFMRASEFFGGLLYMDMLGSAFVSLTLGPWWGAAVGTATNMSGLFIPDHYTLVNFTIVNVALSLFWGYFQASKYGVDVEKDSHRALMLKLVMLGFFSAVIANALVLFIQYQCLPAGSKGMLICNVLQANGLKAKFTLVSGCLIREWLDKTISLALSLYIIRYIHKPGFSWAEAGSSEAQRIFGKIGLVFFILLYACPVWWITIKGCWIENAFQRNFWMSFAYWVLMAGALSSWMFERTKASGLKEIETSEKYAPEHFQNVYDDIIVIVTVILAVSISEGPLTFDTDSGKNFKEIAGLMKFVSLLGYSPRLVRRYFKKQS